MRASLTDAERAGAIEAYGDPTLYDWEYRRRRTDVAFYRMLAAERGGPVLDLGCGTGRLAIPLVRDGHRVLGVDRSIAMLGRARTRLRRVAGSLAARCLLVKADLLSLPVRGGFPLAIAAFHTVQHLIDDRDLISLFRSVRGVIGPDGWFAFDVFFPDPRWLSRPSNRRFDRTIFRHPVTGQKLAYTFSHRMDNARRALHMRLHYQPVADNGAAVGRETTVRLCHRQLSPEEVGALLRRSGLKILAQWGGFQSEPLATGGVRPTEQHVYLAGPIPPRVRHGPRFQERHFARNSAPAPSGNTDLRRGFPLTPPVPPIRFHRLRASRLNLSDGGLRMAEKVEKLGVNRDKDFMYYVKDAAVWRVQRKQPGVPKGKPEKVADGTFQMDTNFIYFVDKEGDVSRAKRAVGGQKRKKSPAKAKKAAKKVAKKPAPTKAKAAKTSKPSRAAKVTKAKKGKAKPAKKKSGSKKRR
jgi:SAM-dependent methyltransferase